MLATSSGFFLTANQPWLPCWVFLYIMARDNASCAKALSVSLATPTSSFFQYQSELIIANPEAISKLPSSFPSLPFIHDSPHYSSFESLEWDSALRSMLALLDFLQASNDFKSTHIGHSLLFMQVQIQDKFPSCPFLSDSYPRPFLSRYGKSIMKLCEHSQPTVWSVHIHQAAFCERPLSCILLGVDVDTHIFLLRPLHALLQRNILLCVLWCLPTLAYTIICKHVPSHWSALTHSAISQHRRMNNAQFGIRKT